MSVEQLLYLHAFTDEILPDLGPAGASPEGWACWLAKPDEDWSRPVAADPGDEFTGWFTEVTTIKVEQRGPYAAPPAGTSCIFLRYGPNLGWDPETMTDDLASAVAEARADDEGPFYFACCKDGPQHRFRFDLQDGKPVLLDLGSVQ